LEEDKDDEGEIRAIILAGADYEQLAKESRKASIPGVPEVYGGFVFGTFRVKTGDSASRG
jgi:hypothetical protein